MTRSWVTFNEYKQHEWQCSNGYCEFDSHTTTKVKIINMCKFERNLNRVYTLSGIVILIFVLMSVTSCGSVNKCSNNGFIKQHNNW